MNPLAWFAKLRRRRCNEAVMTEELQAHLDLQTEDNLRRGMPPADARLAALRAFGGVEQVKERCRDARGWVWLTQAQQDLEYAARSLLAHRAFTAAAVLTLAIGIGVNTTVFSMISDSLLRPSLRDSRDHLVAIHTGRVEGDRTFRPFSYAEYRTLAEAEHVFADVAAMQFANVAVGPADAPQRRTVCLVSGNYFSVLHVRPWRGRFFSPQESAPSARARVLVASYELWRRLGEPADFVGQTLPMNGVRYTVIGIAPAGFGGLQWSVGPEAWLPLGLLPEISGDGASNRLQDPTYRPLELFGRLRSGLTTAGAQPLLAALSAQLDALPGNVGREKREIVIDPPSRMNLDLVWPANEGRLRIYAVAAIGATIAVLLIACLNVANMLFARGIARQKEIAIRLCLGASRGRVVRQLLVEGLLLALLGGAAGLVLSRWSHTLLLESARTKAGPLAMHLQTRWDGQILGSTFALCLLATVLCALVPALKATRRNLTADLKSQGGDAAQPGRWNRLFAVRHCLVMAQIAVSVVLLFSAGLLVRSVAQSEYDRGFALDDRVVLNIDYSLSQSRRDGAAIRQRTLLTRLRDLPGVRSVALASALPYHFTSHWRRIWPAESGNGAPPDLRDKGAAVVETLVTDRFFATMGMPLLRGRSFTAKEGDGPAAQVAVLDESIARTLFGDADPIGRHVLLNQPDPAGKRGSPEAEVIGLVRSPREDEFQGEGSIPRIYRPTAPADAPVIDGYFVAQLAPGAATPALVNRFRREASRLEPNAVLACEPLAEFVGDNLNVWTARVLTLMFGVFGGVAIILAVIGVYGVKAHAVARRTREIGIRIAIGARPANVLALLLRQGLVQTAIGIGGGVVLAVLAGGFLSKLLYRVNGSELLVLVLATVPVGVVAIFACLVPAWRAMRINPTDALRTE